MAKDKVYTADQGQPPAEPDSASAGKPVSKKDQPEQLGSGIVIKNGGFVLFGKFVLSIAR